MRAYAVRVDVDDRKGVGYIWVRSSLYTAVRAALSSTLSDPVHGPQIEKGRARVEIVARRMDPEAERNALKTYYARKGRPYP